MIHVTDTVELLEYPYGIWEVDAIDESTGTVYLVDNFGTILCNENQIILK
jgi:hypothetical protein